MLKMLVTMTSYLTNTISSCQEFTDSVANMRMSFNSAGSKIIYYILYYLDFKINKKNYIYCRKRINKKTVNKISN